MTHEPEPEHKFDWILALVFAAAIFSFIIKTYFFLIGVTKYFML